jgi:dTDP-glucose 4,6-dehydratase
MRHVITGGSGFTGSYMASALLKQGERVVVFDLDDPPSEIGSVDYVKGDIRHDADVKRLHLDKDDLIYHLAARQFHGWVPRRNRDAWFANVNEGGTACLLRAMASASTQRLIFFSTDMTYGKPEYTPVAPTHVQRPIGPYGRSKVGAERLLARANTEFGLKATVFRPRLIAGAGRLGILRKLFWLIKNDFPVPLIGAGRNRYQMIAVEDCVSAALRAVERDCPPGPFNLGSKNPPAVRELLGELIRRAGSRSLLIPTPAMVVKATLSLTDRLGLSLLYPEQFAVANLEYVLDTETTKTGLGWEPTKNDVDIIFSAYSSFLAGSEDAAD